MSSPDARPLELRPHPRWTTKLIVVRHGQTDWNVEGRIQGMRPVELNAKGRQQLREAGDALVGLEPARVLTSPALRTVQSAQLVCEQIGFDADRIEHEPGLSEFDMGSWEDRLVVELMRDEPGWRVYLDAPDTITFPDGESMAAIQARCVAAVNAAVAASEGGSIVCVTHAGIARMLVLTALGMPLSGYHRLSISNGSISRIRLTPGRPPRLYSVDWRPTLPPIR